MPPGKPLPRRRAPARLDLALAAVVDSAAAADFPAADLAAEAEELFSLFCFFYIPSGAREPYENESRNNRDSSLRSELKTERTQGWRRMVL